MKAIVKKESKNGKLKPKKLEVKPERYVKDKSPKIHVEPIRNSTVSSVVSRIEKKQEKQRLSDRGVY